MKVSKLFHWLYAFLMLLPVFALLPSTFYFAFNEHASEYTHQTINETYQFETNDVNSKNDLVNGNIYLLNLYNIGNENYTDVDFYVELESDYIYYRFNNTVITLSNGGTLSFLYSGSNSEDTNEVIFRDTNSRFSYTDFDTIRAIYFIYNSDTFEYEISSSSIFNQFITDSDYLGEYATSINESEMNPLSVFDNAVNAVVNFPLFSWAKTSFLVTPFSYIGNLFGVPASNPLITFLSYWLSISIIWLVFDLVMYVPLLVHRWIDKGIVE